LPAETNRVLRKAPAASGLEQRNNRRLTKPSLSAARKCLRRAHLKGYFDMINVSVLAAKFRQQYGKEPRFFHAPGRVNLIGEHTDYNEGFVLPMAIDRGTTVAIAARSDRILRVLSLNLDASIDLDLDRLGLGRSGTWRDYVEGMAAALLEAGAGLIGADIALESNVSIGGGLSSSAALEIALGLALVSIANSPIEKLTLAHAGQTAEHRHVGINSGIMDQYISISAIKNHAILLDCRSLKARQIPLRLDEHQIAIIDSRVRHTLGSSEYNLRRRDCESGVNLLSRSIPGIHALRDVTSDQLEANRSLLPEPVLSRCRHVISENERTLKAADALAAGDLKELGKLMYASHRSLRLDYEVSCNELDLLVKIAEAQPAVLGARMTGGGFGGCTVNIVERRRIDSFIENASREYQAKTGIIPAILVTTATDGAREAYPIASEGTSPCFDRV
jgi:galactokinase